ncbi:exodeoxyribonuclease III [Candidatus Saccharibacteria bacterium]|nr:exodeoxyribonuclease III [Candidatus Saccharibacteria bacterium]
MLKIFSWNVNGIRAVLRKKALQNFVFEYQPDILCLQETKAKPEQVEFDFPGYKVFWNPADRAGYSGTAILVSSALDLSAWNVIRWDAERTALTGEPLGSVRNIHPKRPNLDFVHASETSTAVPEGRVQILESQDFYLVNVYTPNSKPDLSRLDLRYKTWDPKFLNLLKDLEMKKPVITCGDFNAAHQNIDLARPDANHKNAGFTDEEREGISNILASGFIDTFRFLHPNSERYTWWSHWGNARANNVGWRIDYFFVSANLRKKLVGAEIYESVFGSDHCPISIELKLKEE